MGCEIHWNTVGGMGGGIAADIDAHPVIRDCHIHDNTASTGGGICVSAAGGLVVDCIVEGNSATFGGGIAAMSATGLTVESTRVRWNESVHSGGGIYISDSECDVVGCEVDDNSTQGWGGGMWLLNSDVRVAGTRFTENWAGEATGGILIDTSTLEVTSGEIHGNGVGLSVQGTGSAADARYNWWGAASGPYHPTENPGGLGDAVTDGVLFTPWNSVTGIEGGATVPVSWSAIKAMHLAPR